MISARISGWIAARGERKLLVVLLGVALASALVFLALAMTMAGRGVRAEHEASAHRIAGLFEASLKNAMLKRDLPGLDDIVRQLGSTPGVREVLILNPDGEVRFSARDERVGQRAAQYLEGLCLQAGCVQSPARLTWLDSGAEGMRIAWPVRNEVRCNACHGPVDQHPVNGILVIDLSAAAGSRAVQHAMQPLVFAGLLAIALTASSLVWALRRVVLRPLARLTAVTDQLAEGDLSQRARLPGNDELARLGRHFDGMAERLAGTLAMLERDNTFMQGLLDAIPDPVLVIDKQYRIVRANIAYRKLLHLSGDCEGHTCHLTSRGLSEPCPSTLLACPVHEVLAMQQGTLRSVMSLRRSDGGEVAVEIDAASLVDSDGRQLVVEVLRPLDQKVKFSQEQRLSAIGLLANGVAHEIRNPLASIRVALQGAQRRLGSQVLDRDAFANYLQLVDREVDRCVSITERLLRISQPPVPGEARPTAAAPPVTETLELLAEEAKALRIRMEVDIQPENLAVMADDAELRMLTLNLAQNAFHAMPQGGLLRVGIRQSGGMGEFVFQDSGVGIPPEDLPLIFMPFFSHRADGKTGSGLGLAICKAMVERFSGSINAASTPGCGTAITICLPLA